MRKAAEEGIKILKLFFFCICRELRDCYLHCKQISSEIRSKLVERSKEMKALLPSFYESENFPPALLFINEPRKLNENFSASTHQHRKRSELFFLIFICEQKVGSVDPLWKSLKASNSINTEPATDSLWEFVPLFANVE